MTRPVGRPTKYRAEMCDLVDDYLLTCVDKVSTFHKTRGEKSDSYDRILKVKLPTLEGFAIFLGVTTSSIYEWANKHPEFSESLKKILDEQKQRLLNKGASGEYNSTIAKLILSANHGMAEKKETVNTHKIEDVPEETKEQIKGILD